jgi:hypothetical protein
METQREYHYTYYSYEEWGRGYFGSRTCKCLPEEDIKYFGTFKDKTFKPTQKIILKSDYSTRKEANADEIILHDYYDVANNPHFANQAKQTSTGFCYFPSRELASRNGKKSAETNRKNGTAIFGMSKEQRIENGRKVQKTNKENNTSVYGLTLEQRIKNGKKGGKISGQKNKENKIGFCGFSKEQRRKNAKKSIETNKKNKTAIFALTPEQRRENGKKAAETNKKNGTAIYELSKKQRSEIGKKSSTKNKENKVGIFSLTSTELSENGKKGGAVAAKIINAQRWECCETGYVSTAAGVVQYQKGKGIDTSKSNRRRIA